MKHSLKKLLSILAAAILLFSITGCSPAATPASGQAAPEMRVADGYVQWRVSPGAEWQNLIATDELKGETGTLGISGEEGETGEQGEPGEQGEQGESGEQGEKGATGAAGPQGATGAAGADGREIEIQNNGSYIQWRYEGDAIWNNLVALSAITGSQGATGVTGPQGPQGVPGADGTVLAYAQYEVTGYDQAHRLTFEDDINEGASLISRSGSNITLASGHTYLVTYSIRTYYLEEYFAWIEPNYDNNNVATQLSDSINFGLVWKATFSSSFLVQGGQDLSFSIGWNSSYSGPIIATDDKDSIVTVLCIS